MGYSQRSIARATGATWSANTRAWTIKEEALAKPGILDQISNLLPARYRPNQPGPWLTPSMVPQPLWGRNLRTLLTKTEWDRIRSSVYDACGKRCTICGSAGSKWPVEADEVWYYDDATNTQTLIAVVGLCPSCHQVRHWGKAITDGHREKALYHLAFINRWSLIEATQATRQAMELWHSRSQRQWTSDYSFAARTYGVTFTPDGSSRADDANKRLIRQAHARLSSTTQAKR
ncbi:hypothetical protein QQ056_14795 [Oscillatoria laete-virens NRMC-F 0139]|nr:hypothetical protein [Oscillatoria laete-virens]MDL5054805.1 hypothetical protein [Oscillatoria laete-virens NRMC-F 0139]